MPACLYTWGVSLQPSCCYMKLKLNLNRRAVSQESSYWVSPLVWAMYAAFVTWFFIALIKPAPQVAPAMQTQSSIQYKMDQSPEARLLGVETGAGWTPPSIALLGLFANTRGQGAAVMSIEGQSALSKKAGDEVANGWRLVQVGATFVTLRRGGQTHQVNLPIPTPDSDMLRRVPAHSR